MLNKVCFLNKVTIFQKLMVILQFEKKTLK